MHLCCSDTLGVWPLWGDAPDRVVKEYQAKLGMSDIEMDLLYCAQRADNINCGFIFDFAYGHNFANTHECHLIFFVNLIVNL